jgi:hypothetical protein
LRQMGKCPGELSVSCGGEFIREGLRSSPIDVSGQDCVLLSE